MWRMSSPETLRKGTGGETRTSLLIWVSCSYADPTAAAPRTAALLCAWKAWRSQEHAQERTWSRYIEDMTWSDSWSFEHIYVPLAHPLGNSVLGNVTGPDPKAAAWTASLRCAGQELANCIMTNSAPSIAPELTLATQGRLPAMHCLIPVAQSASTESSSSVQRETPELCPCQSQERLMSSIFCSWSGKSSTILVMAQWNRMLRMRDRNWMSGAPQFWSWSVIMESHVLHAWKKLDSLVQIDAHPGPNLLPSGTVTNITMSAHPNPASPLMFVAIWLRRPKSSCAQINSENSAEHNEKKAFCMCEIVWWHDCPWCRLRRWTWFLACYWDAGKKSWLRSFRCLCCHRNTWPHPLPLLLKSVSEWLVPTEVAAMPKATASIELQASFLAIVPQLILLIVFQDSITCYAMPGHAGNASAKLETLHRSRKEVVSQMSAHTWPASPSTQTEKKEIYL